MLAAVKYTTNAVPTDRPSEGTKSASRPPQRHVNSRRLTKRSGRERCKARGQYPLLGEREDTPDEEHLNDQCRKAALQLVTKETKETKERKE